MFVEEIACFDPNNNPNPIPEVSEAMEFPQTVQTTQYGSFVEAEHPGDDGVVAAIEEFEPQQQTLDHASIEAAFNVEEENCFDNNNINIDHTHLIHQMIQDHSNTHQVLLSSYNEIQVDLHSFNNNITTNINNGSIIPESPVPPTQDLLNLFHLPPKFQLPCSSIETFLPDHNAAATTTVMYDPLFHLNAQLAPHPPSPLMRELFQSLPGHSCFFGDSPPTTTTLFGGNGCSDDHINNIGEGSGGLLMYPHHQLDVDGRKFDGGVFEFGRDMAGVMGKGRERKDTKHYTTDREKRSQLNDKYTALKSLIPSPSKSDRASIVGDAIEYIQELLRTVRELELLVGKKRCGRDRRSKRTRTELAPAESGDIESCITKSADDVADQSSFTSTLRTSWLQRKSKVTEVDVRIIDDEVTIKLVQRKKINCLLYVSRVLDELQLDLHHVAGGQIGEHYSFLFNSKIYEGSSVYASAIASKLMEAVDAQYSMVHPASSY